jgi:nucleolar GTP-binding protein
MNDPNRRKLLRDEEAESGGAGVFNVDLKRPYLLKDDSWKYDAIPEIMDGKNVADFFDPDVEARLEALEREEERLEAEGFYAGEVDSDDEELGSDEEALQLAAKEVEEKRQRIIHESKLKKGKNKPLPPVQYKARVCILNFIFLSLFFFQVKLTML